MSADNGIYILRTITRSGYEYRVTGAQAIVNLDWYAKNDPEKLPNYLKDTWGNSDVYKDSKEAFVKAWEMLEKILASDYPILEYGVDMIYLNTVFP